MQVFFLLIDIVTTATQKHMNKEKQECEVKETSNSKMKNCLQHFGKYKSLISWRKLKGKGAPICFYSNKRYCEPHLHKLSARPLQYSDLLHIALNPNCSSGQDKHRSFWIHFTVRDLNENEFSQSLLGISVSASPKPAVREKSMYTPFQPV